MSFPEAEEEVRERFRQDGKQFRFVSYVSRVRGDVQNREVAQNATGGLDVEMAGNPTGPNKIPLSSKLLGKGNLKHRTQR